jgi:hypothetical protein
LWNCGTNYDGKVLDAHRGRLAQRG